MASYLSWLIGELVLRLRVESLSQVTIARLASWNSYFLQLRSPLKTRGDFEIFCIVLSTTSQLNFQSYIG